MDKFDFRRAWITIVIASAWAAIMACEIPGMTATPATQTPTPLPPEVWPISTDEYVFIDHHIHTHGDLIMGAYQELMIDFPTYQFDQEAGTLMGSIDFEIDEELKVIFGSGSSLSCCAGGGAATRLTGVYEVPYERDGFTIERIEPDGTAYIEYDGESIVLASGEEWVKEESRFDTQPPLGVARLTTTDKIVNYGILDKSGIEEW
jgi:hypothetical protein